MQRNKLKPLPTDPPKWISDAGRRCWRLVRGEIVRAGYDDGRFAIVSGLLTDSFASYLRSCELTTHEYADARQERIDLRREMLVRILEEFPGVELPFTEAGDELRACRLDASLKLREIECEISETVAEGERWHDLLRTQSSLHWRLITLTLLIDSDEFLRKLEADADDDSGESWKGGDE